MNTPDVIAILAQGPEIDGFEWLASTDQATVSDQWATIVFDGDLRVSWDQWNLILRQNCRVRITGALEIGYGEGS